MVLRILTDLWVGHETQLKWFCETSQNLSSFRQHFFFIISKGGPSGKDPITIEKYKSCLNELKFWQGSRNHKLSKISAVYLMWNPENYQDPKNHRQDDPFSLICILLTTIGLKLHNMYHSWWKLHLPQSLHSDNSWHVFKILVLKKEMKSMVTIN